MEVNSNGVSSTGYSKEVLNKAAGQDKLGCSVTEQYCQKHFTNDVTKNAKYVSDFLALKVELRDSPKQWIKEKVVRKGIKLYLGKSTTRLPNSLKSYCIKKAKETLTEKKLSSYQVVSDYKVDLRSLSTMSSFLNEKLSELTENLFRQPGTVKDINSIKEKAKSGELDAKYLKSTQPHAVSSAFKSILKDEKILSMNDFDRIRDSTPETVKDTTNKIFDSKTKYQQLLLQQLAEFAEKADKYHSKGSQVVNGDNLVISIGASLYDDRGLRPTEEISFIKSLKNPKTIENVVEFLNQIRQKA
ncbi:RhoGAP domain-containing protein [uncultured Endozoicomonas sp.]|uniref:RhoGAP domain-containing protein n=1 Tax=uncultured Endozoicomonas sp. TaxID=432652 RepID=UPI002601F143|nr:RhoGAP domain-containing protein [uncultured Endozoicomonas sp.]